MQYIEIVPVRKSLEFKAFVDLPRQLYGDDPNWVPGLRSDQLRLLDPLRHPFWRTARRELFLARRGEEYVGRIAAIVDAAYNQFHGESMGIWGFFECRYDPEVARLLFVTAEQWLRGQSMQFIRGPLNPSTNYTVGLLIQGFDSPPTLMMTYNPPYYLELVRNCGFKKAKDLYAYRVTRGFELPDWITTLAERTAAKYEISIRQANPRKLKDEIRLMNHIYNECWSTNWGFVPMSDAEVEDVAKDLASFFDSDLGFFLYHKGEPIGECLLFPDVNPLIKRLNGRLGPSALIKRYLYQSDIKGVRALTFGIKEAYRYNGVPLIALHRLLDLVDAKPQYHYVEFGWNLEDNHEINGFFEQVGLQPYKIYRIYQKPL